MPFEFALNVIVPRETICPFSFIKYSPFMPMASAVALLVESFTRTVSREAVAAFERLGIPAPINIHIHIIRAAARFALFNKQSPLPVINTFYHI